MVWIGFAGDELSKKARGPLAKRICELVKLYNPHDDHPVSLDWKPYAGRKGYGTFWPDALENIALLRTRRCVAYQVINTECGWMLMQPQKHIQAAVDDKAASLPRYAADYVENWLLVVAEGMGGSSFVGADEGARAHQYVSPFERAFFYEHFAGRWFELRRGGSGNTTGATDPP